MIDIRNQLTLKERIMVQVAFPRFRWPYPAPFTVARRKGVLRNRKGS